MPFNLGVTASEAAARATVDLPFEHQGEGFGRAYDDGDALSYLPRAAGGGGGGGGGGGDPPSSATFVGTHSRHRPSPAARKSAGIEGVGGGGRRRGAAAAEAAGTIVYARDSEDDERPDSGSEGDEAIDFES